MKRASGRFLALDFLFLFLAIAPLVAGIVIKILTAAPSEGIEIAGAQIYATLHMPIQDLLITEAQINSWLVILSILGICLFLTHGLAEKPTLRRQWIVEWLVEKMEAMVTENMGAYFSGFAPFITGIIALSALSSLLSLLGLFPPTSDINIVGGWAILVFILITFYKFKCGPLQYLKSYGDPVPFLAPLNIISEVATPISMAFRHYGNILSGYVISVLVASGLQGLSAMILKWLPGALARIPLLRIGLPAVLSLYFDLFSGCLQAYIFAMLTMLYITNGFPLEKYEARQKIKQQKKQATVPDIQNGGKQTC